MKFDQSNRQSKSTRSIRSMLMILATMIGIGWTNTAIAATCSPVNGQWSYSGRLGPIITQSGNNLTVDMSAYGRPTATGQIISPTQISVTFPDGGTTIGTLNGRGQISWNNGTAWQTLNFAGTWQYEGVPGPVITQSGSSLSVNMSSYSRPTATGSITAPSIAQVTFPDGNFTDIGTLVSPSCIQWGNGTTWTKGVIVPTPPSISSRYLTVELTTGSDDLRGGNNAFITLNRTDGTSTREISLGGGFGQNSVVRRQITLPNAISSDQIMSVTIRHDGSPRNPFDTYDNWDLQRLSISLANSSFSPVANIYNSVSDPARREFVIRFSGASRQIVLPRQ